LTNELVAEIKVDETLIAASQRSQSRRTLASETRWGIRACSAAGRRLFPESRRASLRLTDSVTATKGVLMASYELDRD